MINELKRIWRNYKYYFLFLTVIEISLIIWYFTWQKGTPPNQHYSEIIRFVIFIFPATLLSFLIYFKNGLKEFDLCLPKNRIIIFFNRVTPIFIFTLILYLIMDMILFPSIKAYNYIHFYIVLLIVFTSIIIYSNYFAKYFLRFFILFFIVFILVSLVGINLRLEIPMICSWFIITSFNQYFYIILGIFLIPLFLFFLNYRENNKYKFKVIAISFVLLLLLFTYSFYFSFLTRSGRISTYSFNNGVLLIYKYPYDLNQKTVFYNIKEKCYIKPITLGRKYLFKNKYGSIQTNRFNWNNKDIELYIAAKDYKLKVDYINLYILDRFIYPLHHEIYIPEFIYIVNNNTLYKIHLKDFKKEIIFDDIEIITSHFSLCFEKDGIIYGADERVGIFKALDKKLMAMVQYNEIYYYDIKSKVIMNQDGEIIYKLKNEKVTYNYRYINIKGDNKTRKVVYKDKVYEIPKEARFTNGKIYYRKDNKIILEDLGGNVLVTGDYPENEILYIRDKGSIRSHIRNKGTIHFHNNNYYWILPAYKKSIRDPFALYSSKKSTKILLVYKAVDNKFELYDTVR